MLIRVYGDSETLEYAIGTFSKNMNEIGIPFAISTQYEHADLLILNGHDEASIAGYPNLIKTLKLRKAGYAIQKLEPGEKASTVLVGYDDMGTFYGILDVCEQLKLHGELSNGASRVDSSWLKSRSIQ